MTEEAIDHVSAKPMWKEGLFMMPQHLQLMDAYHERLLDRRFSAVLTHGWGVSQMEVDADELARGVFSLSKCLAIMPDGTLVELREPLRGPAVSGAAGLRVGTGTAEVYLSLASAEIGGVVASAGSTGARFRHEVLTVPDAFGSAQDAEVDVLHPNLRLTIGAQELQNSISIKLAELELDESGRLRVSSRYIPPCLQVRASPALMSGLARLVSVVGAKQKDLVSKVGDRSASLVEFGAADLATFLYLHTVNSWLPVFLHAAEHGELHPEQLYLSLATFAAQLSTFEGGSNPAELPRFNYLDLGGSLLPLLDKIFALLGSVVSARYQSIPLEQTQPGLFVGRTNDPQLLRESALYLLAGGDIAEEALRDDLPRYIKVGSIDQIAKIVHSALPGVTVRQDLSPPHAIPVRAHMLYLKLDKQGRYWDSVVQSGTIAIYQPVKPERVKLELVAVEA